MIKIDDCGNNINIDKNKNVKRTNKLFADRLLVIKEENNTIVDYSTSFLGKRQEYKANGIGQTEEVYPTEEEEMISILECIKESLINNTDDLYYKFKKFLYPLKMSNQRNREGLIKDIIKILEEKDRKTKGSDISKLGREISKESPAQRDDKKSSIVKKLMNKCSFSHEYHEKSVFAEVVTGKFLPSYKDVKDALTYLFGLQIRDFAGVSRTPDNKAYAFIVDEEALKKYLKTRPNPDAGYIRPWLPSELSQRIPLVTTITSKVLEFNCKNKSLKRSSKNVLESLNMNQSPSSSECILNHDPQDEQNLGNNL